MTGTFTNPAGWILVGAGAGVAQAWLLRRMAARSWAAPLRLGLVAGVLTSAAIADAIGPAVTGWMLSFVVGVAVLSRLHAERAR